MPHSLDQTIALKRRANALRPIFKLPEELLLQILRYLRDRPTHRIWFYKWTRALHASHRFYDVGLRCPTLWTRITATLSLEWMREVLRRTRGLPLDVYIHNEFARDPRVLDELMSQIFRIHTLSLKISYSQYLRLSEGAQRSGKSAGVLRYLTLRFNSESFLPLQEPIRLSSLFPHDQLSNLRTLSIRSNTPVDGRISTPELRKLALYSNNDYSSGLQDLQDLRTSLRDMPHLEHIVFHNVLPAGDNSGFLDSSSLMQAVILPSVKFLDITDYSGTDVAALLNSIHIPTNATLALCLKTIPTEDAANLVAAIDKCMKILPDGRDELRQMRTLTISRGNCEKDYVLIACPHIHGDSEEQGLYQCKADSMVSIYSEFTGDDAINLSKFLSLRAFTSIHTLHITGQISCDGTETEVPLVPLEYQAVFFSGLSSLYNVERVVIPVMWCGTKMPTDIQGMREIFPNLRELVVGDAVSNIESI